MVPSSYLGKELRSIVHEAQLMDWELDQFQQECARDDIITHSLSSLGIMRSPAAMESFHRPMANELQETLNTV